MTNREAIDMLEEMQHDAFINCEWNQRDALIMAMEALRWYDEFLKAIEKKRDEYWKSFKVNTKLIPRYPEEYDEWKYRFTCSGAPYVISPSSFCEIRKDLTYDE